MSRPRTVRPEAEAVSALFTDPAAVDRALARLVALGIPRDLIEVVVSPEAAALHYEGRAQARRREAFRYAGIGGLTGLITGAIVSIIMIAWPGFQTPDALAIVQLLGPNFMTVGGAAVGGLIGLFVHRRPRRIHARALEAPVSIVVVVTTRSEEETTAVVKALAESGGSSPRLER